jgi:hypothetical protein
VPGDKDEASLSMQMGRMWHHAMPKIYFLLYSVTKARAAIVTCGGLFVILKSESVRSLEELLTEWNRVQA